MKFPSNTPSSKLIKKKTTIKMSNLLYKWSGFDGTIQSLEIFSRVSLLVNGFLSVVRWDKSQYSSQSLYQCIAGILHRFDCYFDTKKNVWNYHNLSDLILWPYKKTQLTLMAHKRLDAELIRPGKEQFQPLIEWMLSKIWRWHHYKKQQKQMVKLIYALEFDIFFSSFLFVCLLAQLTGSKIVHRPLCCSNHRHNRQVSCRKYHKVIRKQCTLTRAIGWNTRPTVYNIRIDNIPWCKHRLC